MKAMPVPHNTIQKKQYPSLERNTGEGFITALGAGQLAPEVLETEESRKRLLYDIPAAFEKIVRCKEDPLSALEAIKNNLLNVIGLKGFKSHRNIFKILWSLVSDNFAMPKTWSLVVASQIKFLIGRLNRLLPQESTQPYIWRFQTLYEFLNNAKNQEKKLDTKAIAEQLSAYLGRMQIAESQQIIAAYTQPASTSPNHVIHPELISAIVEYFKKNISGSADAQYLPALRDTWYALLEKIKDDAALMPTIEDITAIETLFYQRAILSVVRREVAAPAGNSATTFDTLFNHCFPQKPIAAALKIAKPTNPSVEDCNVTTPICNAAQTLERCIWINTKFATQDPATFAMDNVNCRFGAFSSVIFDGQKINHVNFKDAEMADCSFKGATLTDCKLPLLYIDQVHIDANTKIDSLTLKSLIEEAGKIVSQGVYANGNQRARTFAEAGWSPLTTRHYDGEPIKGASMVRNFALQQLQLAFTQLLPTLPLLSNQQYMELIKALDALPQQIPGFNLPFTQKRAWHKAIADLKYKLLIHARKQLEKEVDAPLSQPGNESPVVATSTRAAADNSKITRCKANPDLDYEPPVDAVRRRRLEADLQNRMTSATNPHAPAVVPIIAPLLQAVLNDEHSAAREHRHWWMPHCSEPRFFETMQVLAQKQASSRPASSGGERNRK